VTNLPPGVYVTASTSNPPRSSPTDTGVAFLLAVTSRAPALPTALTDLGDYNANLNGRQAYSTGYDWCDEAFHEGASRIIVSSVYGPAAAKASINIPGTSGTGIVLTAADLGDYANGAAGGLTAEVANGPTGSSTRVIIIRRGGIEIFRTLEQTTNQALVDQFATFAEVTAALGGGSGLVPVMAVANFTGGTIDRTNILDAHWQAALDRIPRGMGPGNIAAPDWGATVAHPALLAHAAARNRFAVLDAVDTTSKATLLTTAAAQSGGVNASYGALVAPWVTIPGLAPGSTGRAVPGSAMYCGCAARTDALDSANQAPAGAFGVSRYATAVRATFSSDTVSGVNDQGDLNAAGVNLIIVDNGDVMLNGNRTLVSPTGTDRNWLQASNARYRMSVIARAGQSGRPYLHRKVSKTTIDGFHNVLEGMLLADYGNGDLFGDLDDDRPATAFNVNTLSVNDAASIQAGQLNAALTVRPTRGAEMVNILITAVALTEPVA
jgi:hypothetical protein